jgi:hypothetical protein
MINLISSPGPDRSKVSEQQERSNQEAISRARDSQQYDYTAPKQIAKHIAINTGKNLAGKKIASTLRNRSNWPYWNIV